MWITIHNVQWSLEVGRRIGDKIILQNILYSQFPLHFVSFISTLGMSHSNLRCCYTFHFICIRFAVFLFPFLFRFADVDDFRVYQLKTSFVALLSRSSLLLLLLLIVWTDFNWHLLHFSLSPSPSRLLWWFAFASSSSSHSSSPSSFGSTVALVSAFHFLSSVSATGWHRVDLPRKNLPASFAITTFGTLFPCALSILSQSFDRSIGGSVGRCIHPFTRQVCWRVEFGPNRFFRINFSTHWRSFSFWWSESDSIDSFKHSTMDRTYRRFFDSIDKIRRVRKTIHGWTIVNGLCSFMSTFAFTIVSSQRKKWQKIILFSDSTNLVRLSRPIANCQLLSWLNWKVGFDRFRFAVLI